MDSSDYWSEWSENGSSDQWSGAFLWVPLPEINQCAQRLWPWITYVFHIWDVLQWSFPRSADSICFVVSGRNYLNLFLPIIESNLSENQRSASQIQIFEWLVQKLSVLPRNCRITPVNTRACNLYDGISCFVTALLEILFLAINLFVCYSDLILLTRARQYFALTVMVTDRKNQSPVPFYGHDLRDLGS